MKRFLYYFGCTLVVGIVLYIGVKYQTHLQIEGQKTFEPQSYIAFKSVFPIIIGVILGLPKLILVAKEKTEWTFDWIKAMVIGLPTLYVTILPIIAFDTPFGANLPFVSEVLTLGHTMIVTTTGIIFGYVLIDSLKRR
ncbi:hypothetical protein [Ornithinibacillus californiensis]|uniref:hypothetical protein n=1 Tax=Ornithinibacillus californiensis TaxID=161536 RepID=UPI00064D7EC8|nr:hypothetical protein [Ornithinibacillus californiensis]